MAKQKNIVVSFRIEPEYLKKLKTLARKRSVKEDADITYADVIREMIKKKVEKI